MSKGHRQRTHNTATFNDNYDKIFGANNVRHDEQVSKQDAKAVSNEQNATKQKEKIV